MMDGGRWGSWPCPDSALLLHSSSGLRALRRRPCAHPGPPWSGSCGSQSPGSSCSSGMFTWRCLILWAVLVAAALSAARPAPTLPDQGKRHPLLPRAVCSSWDDRAAPPCSRGRGWCVLQLWGHQHVPSATRGVTWVPLGTWHVLSPAWSVWAQKWVCGSSSAWGRFKPGGICGKP